MEQDTHLLNFIFDWISPLYEQTLNVSFPYTRILSSSERIICQSPPLRISSLSLQQLSNFNGQLRQEGSNEVIGVWNVESNCYVNISSPTNSCVNYVSPYHVTQCENDIRLQINLNQFDRFNFEYYWKKQQSALQSNVIQFKNLVHRISSSLESILLQLPTQEDAQLLLQQYQLEINSLKSSFFLRMQMLLKTILQLISNDYSQNEFIYFQSVITSDRFNRLSVLLSSLQSVLQKMQDPLSFYSIMNTEEMISLSNKFTFQYSQFLKLHLEFFSSSVEFKMIYQSVLKLFPIYYSTLWSHFQLYQVYTLSNYWNQFTWFSNQSNFALANLFSNSTLIDQSMSSTLVQLTSTLQQDFLMMLPSSLNSTTATCYQTAIQFLYNSTAQMLKGSQIPWNQFESLYFSCKQRQVEKVQFHFANQSSIVSITSFLNSTIYSLTLINSTVQVLSLNKRSNNIFLSSGINLTQLTVTEWNNTVPTETIGIANVSMPSTRNPIQFNCPLGRYGATCALTPPGFWSDDGFLYVCNNAPQIGIATNYTTFGATNPNCPFVCFDSKLYRKGNSCVLPPVGMFYDSITNSVKHCSRPIEQYQLFGFQFTSSGSTDNPYSCGYEVEHIMIMQGNGTVVKNGIVITLTQQLDRSNLQLVLSSGTNQWISLVEFKVGKNTVFIWGMEVNPSLQAKFAIIDAVGNVAYSQFQFALPMETMLNYSLVVYPSSKLVSYFLNTTIHGSSYMDSSNFFSTNTSNFGEYTLILGGKNKKLVLWDGTPLQSRMIGGIIQNVEIWNSIDAFLEYIATSTALNTVKEITTVVCNDPAVNMHGQCICGNFQFFNSTSKTCQWCVDQSMGSRFPRNSINHCDCLPNFLLVNQSCVYSGQTSRLSSPNVTIVFDNPFILDDASTILTRIIPLNATIKIDLPWDTKISYTSTDVYLQCSFTSMQNSFSVQLSTVELPFVYIFSSITTWNINCFYQIGNIKSKEYIAQIIVKWRELPPIHVPQQQFLEDAMILKLATGSSNGQLWYGMNTEVPNMVYNASNPPLLFPPIIVTFCVKPIDTSISLPSAIIQVTYFWNTTSAAYKRYTTYYPQLFGTEDIRNQQTNLEQAWNWCQDQAPVCVSIAASSIIAILLGLFLLRIAISQILFWQSIARKRQLKKVQKRKQLPVNELTDQNRILNKVVKKQMEELQILKSIGCTHCRQNKALFYCSTCRYFSCKHCRRNYHKSNPMSENPWEKHILLRVFVCSHCYQISDQLNHLTQIGVMNQQHQLCEYCCRDVELLPKSALSTEWRLLHRCSSCREFVTMKPQSLCSICASLLK